MIATGKTKHTATQSYRYCQALTAIQELTKEEIISLQRELKNNSSEKKNSLQNNKSDDQSFFLFGKWPDFEDAKTLREKTWKRNFIPDFAYAPPKTFSTA